MDITRPGNTLRCAKCGATGDSKPGSNNWHMCDTCFVAYCSGCWNNSSFCTAHDKWGKWLLGDGGYQMKFRSR